MRILNKKPPEWIKATLRFYKKLMIPIQYYGKGRFCPVCEKSSRKFAPAGIVPREDAKFVFCGSLERHRLLWLYVTNRTNLFNGKPKKILHVAPESCFEPSLRQHLGDSYLTADLSNPKAMVTMDITNIQYPDQSFDVIYCSHVLEHVEDDKKALREFHRTLKSNGWAILLVPITTDTTFEDPTIIEPAERLRIFGHENHVRSYGKDYINKLYEVGFNVKVTTVEELVRKDEILRMGLTSASGEIYYCTKESG